MKFQLQNGQMVEQWINEIPMIQPVDIERIQWVDWFGYQEVQEAYLNMTPSLSSISMEPSPLLSHGVEVTMISLVSLGAIALLLKFIRFYEEEKESRIEVIKKMKATES